MDKEKLWQSFFFVAGVLFVVAVCLYLLREPVSDYRERADNVRAELANTGAAQRDAEKHIIDARERIDGSIKLADEVAGRIDEAAERIADSEERNAECASIVEDSERRIGESKSILQGIRARAGQGGKQAP